ncbi:MAG: phosphate acyltransferase PlsX [Candidatus Desulforudis sp.]|nr:phosphate acyltransferase PlsX [Desulforudis sp.]
MRVAVDAMGGDFAPLEIVKGAEAAAQELKLDVILVGDEEKISAALGSSRNLSIVHAPDIIKMEESPVLAVRRKPQASVVKAVQLVRDGTADAAVSAGNTGATFAASFMHLGRTAGIDRPALLSLIPNARSQTVLVDVGANVDCKPAHLLHFGIMGAMYAQKVLGVTQPRVGLLSIGEEPSKGNELTLAAYRLFEGAPFRFTGNVEGRDLFSGHVDVIVCDGFTGNIVLKTGEGLVHTMENAIKQEISNNWMSRVFLGMAVTVLKNIRRRFDYTEYGGVPLLGVNGVVVVSHGSSQAKSIKNAIRVAGDAVKNNLVGAIADGISEVMASGVETANG